jgi:succinate dehydrogenase/fumarate reductase flavoprotein subunit
LAELKASLYKPLGKKGILPKEVLREIQESVFPCDVSILKQHTSLTRALEKLNKIEAELFPHMAAPDPHYLMKLMEVRSIHLMSQLYVRASLMRTESRAGHYREDYPERDDTKWLGQIMARLDRERFSLRFEPLPMDRYRITPTRYYSDNFTFPRPAPAQS